jgi:cyclohexanone monooxygenase
MRARYVVLSSGPLNRPKLPGIPGLSEFRGHTFHTSRWDYAYTGGDSTGGLTRLADKRVAIIGTGATAIQCVPHVGRHARRLHVFQRTPSSVDERRNSPTDPAWAASLAPGWQKRRMENFNILVMGGQQDEDLVNDGWTDIIRSLGFFMPAESGALSPEEMARGLELADFRKMNQIRARIDTCVKDRATAEALKPWYRQFCKRPTFNDDYLPTFNRPNVTLVDTRGEGVHRIGAKGPIFDGLEYEVDCIIFATGFEVGTAYTRRAGFEIHGRGGRTLSDHWKDGLRTLHGFFSHGFPNCFHMGNTQGTLTANFPHMLVEQCEHIVAILNAARERGARRIEPSAAAEEAWVRTIRDKLQLQRAFFEACTPGYYNNEGHPDARKGLGAEMYGGGSVEFFEVIRRWRAGSMFEDLEIA